MQEGLNESVKFKRQIKWALIVLSVIEFIAMAFGVFYAVHK
jgi:large-conductance mechanosensitive channel